jgi:hypothetical protein
MENKNNQEPIVAIENLIDQFHSDFLLQNNQRVSDFFTELQGIVKRNNALMLKTVAELLPLHFFVDDYQRGYKWQPQQVRQLLNDIHEFTPEQGGFYCLQPVVVKHHAPSISGERGFWELIDGQQRITTIYMILKFLVHQPIFSIEYKTRESSAEFLQTHLPKTLSCESWHHFIAEEGNHNFDNVDNYHFYSAYQTIHDWFEQLAEDNGSADSKVDSIDGWKQKLLDHTKVIWYASTEVTDSELSLSSQQTHHADKSQSIDIFMRINSGKIPLSNSELIKALFLHAVTGGHEQTAELSELAHLQQIEMAQQWDAVEHGLQNNDFWYFLQGKATGQYSATRIELLFDLLSQRSSALKKDNEHFAFNFFASALNDGESTATRQEKVLSLWAMVKQSFDRLQEWFDDDTLYHLAGFLLNRQIRTIDQLWASAENQKKSKFIHSLHSVIGKQLQDHFRDQESKSLSFDRLQYGEHNKQITDVLILLNIAEHQRNKTRLPFEHYAKTDWSREHIHAQHSKELSDKQKWTAWYEQHKQLLKGTEVPTEQRQALLEKLELWQAEADKNSDVALSLFREYNQSLTEVVGEIEEVDMHCLDNLALLSKSVNSSIGNEIFSVKRKRLIEHDRQGAFIPIATKNVFSKYYSDEVEQMHQWSANDRAAYRKRLIQCVITFPGMEGLQ